MQETFVGVVKWFNSVKGYGFIGRCEQTTDWPSEDDKDVFVHYTAINASGYKKLEDGDVVEFSVEEAKNKKTQAINVIVKTNAAKTSQV